MSTYRARIPLTAEQRFRLGLLVRAAAKRMPAAEGREMEVLFGQLLADGQHGREQAGKLGRKLGRARAVAEPPPPEDPPVPCVRIVA